MRPPTTLASCAALAAICLLLQLVASIRHFFFWGGGYAEVLHGFELASLLLGAAGVLWVQTRALRLPAAALRERDALRGGLMLCLCATLLLPSLSEDVFAYLVRGRVLSVHGANPYTHLASEFAAIDPTVAHIKAWADFPLPYGPLAAIYQGAVAWLVEQPGWLPWQARFWLGVYAFKLIHALALVACARVVAGMVAERDAAARARAVVLLLWNPFLLLEVAASGHNDVLMTLPLLLAFAAARRDRHGAAAFWLITSAQLKFVSLVLVPLFFVFAWRRGDGRASALGGGLGAALFAALGLAFWHEPGALAFLSKQTTQFVTPLHAALNGMFGLEHAAAVRATTLGLTAIVAVLVAIRVRRFETLVSGSIVVVATLLLVGLPAAFVWYHLWWAPLAPLAPLAARRVLGCLALCAPLAYAPVLLTRTWSPFTVAWQWTWSFVAPLLALRAPRATRSEPLRPDSP